MRRLLARFEADTDPIRFEQPSDCSWLLRLDLAGAAPAWREGGAGDGNRTHVIGPVPSARSITYGRGRSCV